MAKQGDLVPSGQTAPERGTRRELLDIVMDAVGNPALDVEKMERLLAMARQEQAEQRRIAFVEALARIQSRMPTITAGHEILSKTGKLISKYAKYEDLDAVLRPMLEEEGFAVSFTSVSDTGKVFAVVGTLRHVAGHEESSQFVVPLDDSKYRTPMQNAASSVSYAKRQLVKLIFNIVECGDDAGSADDFTAITEEQARDLQAMAEEIGAPLGKVLEYAKADSFGSILKGDYQRVVDALNEKRRAKK